jgi:hypothetical protein
MAQQLSCEVINMPTLQKLQLKIRGATALTNLGRLSSRRWQSFPTAPDGTGLTCAHRIPQLHYQLSKPDRYFFIQVTTQFIRSRG